MSCCIIILFNLFIYIFIFCFLFFCLFLLLFIFVFCALFCFCFAVKGIVKVTIKLHERVDRSNMSVTTGFVCSEIKIMIFFWRRLNMLF